MAYKEMKTPAKEKNNRPTKPETIDVSDMKKTERKSGIKVDK